MDTVVANARMDTEPDGSLTVTWELEAEPSAVDLAIGPTCTTCEAMRSAPRTPAVPSPGIWAFSAGRRKQTRSYRSA